MIFKVIVSLTILLTFSGCASLPLGSFTHTSALIIGDSKEKVIADSAHFLGSPKTSAKLDLPDNGEQIEFSRYTFTDVYDLGLYFYKGTFVQGVLMEPKAIDEFPVVRGDYKEVRKGSPGPIGYMLTKNKKTASINTIWEKARNADWEPPNQSLQPTLTREPR